LRGQCDDGDVRPKLMFGANDPAAIGGDLPLAFKP